MSLRLLSLIATALPAALAWGHDGHAVVAQLSQERITDETREAIDAIMGEGVPMSNYSSWADNVKHGHHGHEWKWSSPLHYADTPDCHFDYTRDCKNDYCVAGALKNYSRRVVDESLPLEQRQEALKFIVHFVGDAHQPMHIDQGELADGEPSWTITEKAVSDELEKGGRYAGDVDDWVEDCEKLHASTAIGMSMAR
ncbi:hypothetical protein FOL46_005039 [Perkinsus olseni]|uniref:Nuclease S1 n=1 Tax=Perkinsus olseni TaxID=32597 RepID=A0A7J6LUU7_PEROL|nr:hypothetical protein FOL46_005039 [Perkinsus olseni]